MIHITGNLPKAIVDKLSNLNVNIDGLKTGGDDITVTLTRNGTSTSIDCVFVGNGKWEVRELEDNANLFPALEEGDVVTVDFITKLFSDTIVSSLILSFNPLGRVKYGIKDKVDKVRDTVGKIKDWATDQLYAEDAEKFIRGNGPFRRTFTDSRDGKTRTKRDYNAGRVNVGKIENMGKQGHYKVLTGNPATKDFQVWELYKNGNKIQCLDLKTGLQAQEAQWVYDNNIPDTWSETDWNPEGEIPEKASKIEVGHGDVKENNVEEEKADITEQVEQTEEDNVEEELDDFTQFYDGQYDSDVLTEDADNVQEEPKKKKAAVRASLIQSEVEEDNVSEEPKKKKSKYNGCNVTGCVDADGAVALAASLIKSCLLINNLVDFQNKIKGYKLSKLVRTFLTDILGRLVNLPADVRQTITSDSNNNVLLINFGKTDLTTENYIAQFEVYDDEVIATINLGKGNKMQGDDAIKMCKQTLDSIINKKD